VQPVWPAWQKPFGLLHGTPLQQSEFWLHCWPKSAQLGPLSGVPLSGTPLSGVPLSGVPLSGTPLSGTPPSVTLPHGPQVPFVLPLGTTQLVPTQQSALMVHGPHAGWQVSCEQMNGGLPLGLGTHGALLQQFALVAQEPPAATHCAAAQRGTPTESSLQVSPWWQLPLQQSHEALHDSVSRRHTSPSGLQPCGLRHTPIELGGVMSQVTGVPEPPGRPAEPQQSLSFVQRSPTTWQPLAGWQTKAPVGPYGAQRREQHSPPQGGGPPSLEKVPPSGSRPPQSMPSTSWQLAAPVGGAAQVPTLAPVWIWQLPEQQSGPPLQMSPTCPQNDEARHWPR
jgi:hypothetical protein